MKIHNVLFGFIAVAAGAVATIGVVPQANAAGFSTSCVPIGGGWRQCTQKFCTDQGCVVTGVWTQFFQGEQVINE